MPDRPGKPEMLTTTQAAELLNVDRATVARWIRLGQLAAVKLPSGQYRVRRRDLDALLLEPDRP
jgi:excisionase family DNA binding protein